MTMRAIEVRSEGRCWVRSAHTPESAAKCGLEWRYVGGVVGHIILDCAEVGCTWRMGYPASKAPGSWRCAQHPAEAVSTVEFFGAEAKEMIAVAMGKAVASITSQAEAEALLGKNHPMVPPQAYFDAHSKPAAVYSVADTTPARDRDAEIARLHAKVVELDSDRLRACAERDRRTKLRDDALAAHASLADQFGALRTENTELLAENARLRRRAEDAERKAGKR